MSREADLIRLRRLLVREEPMPAADIAHAMGWRMSRAQRLLRLLRHDGLAACTTPGAAAKWSTPARVEAWQAEWQAAAPQRHEAALLRERERKRRVWHEMEARDEEAFNIVTQRVVPAATCHPIRPPAPASVFNLASIAA